MLLIGFLYACPASFRLCSPFGNRRTSRVLLLSELFDVHALVTPCSSPWGGHEIRHVLSRVSTQEVRFSPVHTLRPSGATFQKLPLTRLPSFLWSDSLVSGGDMGFCWNWIGREGAISPVVSSSACGRLVGAPGMCFWGKRSPNSCIYTRAFWSPQLIIQTEVNVKGICPERRLHRK